MPWIDYVPTHQDPRRLDIPSKPRQAHPTDAAFDLFACLADGYPEGGLRIEPGEHAIIPCGFAMAIPTGFVGLVCSRSGLAANQGLFVLNAPGIIDAGYRGEVKVILKNLGDDGWTICDGDRVAQLLVLQLPKVTFTLASILPDSSRENGGLGSTGR